MTQEQTRVDVIFDEEKDQVVRVQASDRGDQHPRRSWDWTFAPTSQISENFGAMQDSREISPNPD